MSRSTSKSSIPNRTATTEGFYRTKSNTPRSLSAASLLTSASLPETPTRPPQNPTHSGHRRHISITSSSPLINERSKSFNTAAVQGTTASYSKGKSTNGKEVIDEPIKARNESNTPPRSTTGILPQMTNTSSIRMRNLPQGTRRSFSARSMTMTDAALAAISFDENDDGLDGSNHTNATKPKSNTLICTICHNGTDVIFATTAKNTIIAICARTRVAFQCLDVPISQSNDENLSIVSLVGNSTTGIILATLSNGNIYTFLPHEAPVFGGVNQNGFSTSKPNFTNDAFLGSIRDYTPFSETTAPFGRYRWCSTQVIHCAHFFEVGLHTYSSDAKRKTEKLTFVRKRTKKQVESTKNETTNEEQHNDYVHVSCCKMNKVLVAYRDQIAVFNIIINTNKEPSPTMTEAELLWITQLHKQILHARLSGDGNAIAVVLQGEGEGVPFPFGVRTFLRDKEDGTFIIKKKKKLVDDLDTDKNKSDYPDSEANTVIEKDLTVTEKHDSSSLAVGVVYKSGPFLNHSKSVTKISWRGGSCHNSPLDDGTFTDGNDLLLTHCKDDSSTRIFAQGNMKQLMQWNTPPGSRADWIYGISVANLGDLDSSKKEAKSNDEDGMWSKDKILRVGSSGFLSSLDEAGGTYQPMPNSNLFPSHPVPSTSAGAWIAELTFRGAFPALRLSRLTYVKSGDEDYQAAHFESVAAILPAGALVPSAVLEGEEESFSVQGFWPVWNPWNKGIHTGAGGSHSPPSELRIVASHSTENRAVILEFPLWGDKDFGAMEFGAPLKYVLVLSDIEAQNETHDELSHPVCLEFESSRLIAQITSDKQSVDLTWRREGSMSVLPIAPSDQPSSSISPSPSTISLESIPLIYSKKKNVSLKQYNDVSITPLPLALPSVRNQFKQGHIICVRWWPDENFGGPPRLLLLTSNGSLILCEMPPPWSALEPPMPVSFSDGNTDKSVVSESEISTKGEYDLRPQQDYEVNIKPHPDFGIGLRLEAQVDGKPAIAGSYKKHPLNGGRLPAEKSGMIILGDELLSVNNVSLEGATFDEIIHIVKKVGADSNGDLWLKFRPGSDRERFLRDPTSRDDVSVGTAESSYDGLNISMGHRRDVLNLSKSHDGHNEEKTFEADNESIATMMVGAEAERQQEFCRIIAMKNCALSGDITAMVLLPWHYGTGAPYPGDIHSAALIVTCSGRTLTASRVEVTNDQSVENSRHFVIGKVDLEVADDKNSPNIRSLTTVKTATEGWCLAACDDLGMITLVFIDVENVGNDMNNEEKTDNPSFSASFRQCHIFQIKNDLSELHQRTPYLLRAYSVQLFAGIPKLESSSEITVWLASPRSYISDSDENQTQYRTVSVSIDPNDTILDFRWLPSGNLDSFPWLVTFSRRSVMVHQRPGSKSSWIAVVELNYSFLLGSSFHLKTLTFDVESNKVNCYDGVLSPADAYPHVITMLREMIEYCDEYKYVRSDWHPDSILAFICTESRGVNVALKRNVRGLFYWLSQWMSPDPSSRPEWNANFNLEIAPLKVLLDDSFKEEVDEDNEPETVQTAASLFSNLSSNNSKKEERRRTHLNTETEMLMLDLQSALKVHQKMLVKSKKKKTTKRKSREFLLAMSMANEEIIEEDIEEIEEIPAPVKNLNEDEILFLRAMGNIVTKPPKLSKLDPCSQLTSFSYTLLRELDRCGTDDQDEGDELDRSFRKQSTFAVSAQSASVTPPGISSGACLSALISNTQSMLLASCREQGVKLDWSTVRALRLPFWLRDDAEIQKIAEEIGQQIFKATKNSMECALFYIAMRKNLKLQTMAKADGNDSGGKLFKFLTNFDFSSERGRRAAEKNAYSLLRKRQYGVAAAFFLLPEPPMLQTALQVIVTQMEDLTLGFFIARLIHYSTKNSINGAGPLKLGSFNGFGSTSVGKDRNSKTEESFEKWTPELSSAANDLLQNQGLSIAKNDTCFEAMLHIWLNKRLQATKCLSEIARSSKGDGYNEIDAISPPSFDTSSLAHLKAPIVPCLSPSLSKTAASFERVIIKSNMIISFCSVPFLLNAMKSDKRALWSSVLHVSRALSRRGLELPNVQMLQQYTNSSDLDETDDTQKLGSNDDTIETKGMGSAKPVSSIFDSYSVPTPTSNPSQSSIFDSFDAPVRPKQKQACQDVMTSSIFDSFDTHAPSKSKKPTGGEMASSIFDSFDAPVPPKSKKPAGGDMTSSIFDAFTAPPLPKSKPKSNAVSQTGDMTSSIFDSFDVPSAKPKVTNDSTQSKKEEITKPSSSSQIEKDLITLLSHSPQLWLEWREHLFAFSAARRLLREMGRVVAKFHGDSAMASMEIFRQHDFPLAPSAATEVFQNQCEGETLMQSVQDCLDELCTSCRLESAAVVEQALLFLGCPGLPRRIVFAVLLHMLMKRSDMAEDVVRDAAHSQMRRCESFAFANDNLVHGRKTTFHTSSLYVRRKAARVSWQLELCLWLYRGGLLPMSGIAVKETIIAVRIGFLIASWGRCQETLESLIKCHPDCNQDPEQGRQLWTSMKVLNFENDKVRSYKGSGSGGWEFLVDCRRDEATNLLRERKPGNFLLRPHPEDHGVFTLSFKTNLIPTLDQDKTNSDEFNGKDEESGSKIRQIAPDDVVQHAIIRLSDSGFRCGSFGPFPSLIKLLQEVSFSLPFNLLFDEPPAQGIIKDQGVQPSPNAFLLRKLALLTKSLKKFEDAEKESSNSLKLKPNLDEVGNFDENREIDEELDFAHKKRFGLFFELLVLSELRKQLSAIAVADFEEAPVTDLACRDNEQLVPIEKNGFPSTEDDNSFVEEDMHGVASRMLRPFLQWCHLVEALLVPELVPCQIEAVQNTTPQRIDVDASDNAIEAAYPDSSSDSGDSVIRQMIQPGSGVEFHTIRVGEGNNSAIVVLFSKSEAMSWLVSSGSEKTDSEADERLKRMENGRVIEEINLKHLTPTSHSKHFPLVQSTNTHGLKDEIHYRFVDPWEVEALESKNAEGKGASLGRERLIPFNLGSVATSCEQVYRSLGGALLLSTWSSARGAIFLTKAIASVHPPWSRDVGSDLQVSNGSVTEPSPFLLSLKKRIYRNAIFRRLGVPQRFVSLIQVELLDLKNLTGPGGSSPPYAFALLRLKRPGSSAPLNLKARTLDSFSTRPKRIAKSSGPNAPASWGTLVRFRFTLPENVDCDCVSYDPDTESLFRGPPSVLQISVYEKKFMSDVLLGGANIKLDGLSSGGQLEEWVPLRSSKEGINWFARIRITLRFEIMCLAEEEETPTEGEELNDKCPSVGLKKIKELSSEGGAHEVSNKGVKKSMSTPDFKSYLENISAF